MLKWWSRQGEKGGDFKMRKEAKGGGEKPDRNCYPVLGRTGDPPAKAARRALAAVGPPFPPVL